MLLRALVIAVGVFAAMPAFELRQASSQTQGDMEGSHPIGIENETQRKLFFSLICMCGCPRETLGTCACNFAHARREEVRGALAEGKSVEDIQAAYAKRYGPQALAVPPNVGVNWLLWAFPLTAIALGAVGVIFMLRKWRGQGSAQSAAASSTPPIVDEYDAKLDHELKELDRE
jgi:cytochrome c-type biogenesis protein CcmH